MNETDLIIDFISNLYNHRRNDFDVMFRHCLAIAGRILSKKLDIIRPHDRFLFAIPFDPTEPLVNTTQTMLNIQELFSERRKRKMNRQGIVLRDSKRDIIKIHDYFKKNCLNNGILIKNNISLCFDNLES